MQVTHLGQKELAERWRMSEAALPSKRDPRLPCVERIADAMGLALVAHFFLVPRGEYRDIQAAQCPRPFQAQPNTKIIHF